MTDGSGVDTEMTDGFCPPRSKKRGCGDSKPEGNGEALPLPRPALSSLPVEEEPPRVFKDETVEKFRREGYGWLKELDEISGLTLVK
jgi:hypothetical protein